MDTEPLEQNIALRFYDRMRELIVQWSKKYPRMEGKASTNFKVAYYKVFGGLPNFTHSVGMLNVIIKDISRASEEGSRREGKLMEIENMNKKFTEDFIEKVRDEEEREIELRKEICEMINNVMEW